MAELDPRDEAYQCFVQEAVEHLQGLELGLLNLQQDHSTQQINTLMRHAHSLKGGASLFGLTASQNLAHNLENAFKSLYAQTVPIDAELEELLLQAYDCLREPLLDQIERQVYAPALAVARSKQVFDQLEARFGHSLSGDDIGLPEPDLMLMLQGLESEFPDLVLAEAEAEAHHNMEGVLHDIEAQFPELLAVPDFHGLDPEQQQVLAQILETELIGFANLQQSPPSKDRQATLLAEAQKFQEIGDYFGVLGLSRIAQTAAAALQSHTADLNKVGQCILADLLNAQHHIAKGQVQAVAPSPALLALMPVAASIRPLVPANNGTASASVAPEHLQSPENTAAAAAPAPVTVRVEVSCLETLNNLTGELVTLDNGLLLQQQEYKTLSDRLRRWQTDFRQFGRRMTDDAVLNIRPELITQLQSLNSDPSTSNALFDDPSDDGVGFARDVIQQVTDQVIEAVMQMMSNESFKLDEILQDFSATNKLHKSIIGKQEQSLKQLQTNLLQAQMVPLQDLLNRFPRMVRDLATRFEKQVTLTLPAEPILVDKIIVEKLYDPLLHLVRNAFDHGIEPPEKRLQRGKPAQGQIKINAYHRGNSTWIEVQDDGEGIKLSKIRAKLLNQNLATPDQVNCLSKEELYEYLFHPGFSTTDVTTELSGRGVGLDAVRLQVAALRGDIRVKSELGEGTTFILRLPFNLSVTQLHVFTVNGGGLAIPAKDLTNVKTVKKTQLEQQGSHVFYRYVDKRIPVITNLQRPTHARADRQLFGPMLGLPEKEEVTLLFVVERGEEIGILIDQTLMQQDLVVKTFSNLIKTPNYLTGCTILGDGRLIAVLDGPGLLTAWRTWREEVANLDTTPPAAAHANLFVSKEEKSTFPPEAGDAAAVAPVVPPTILVVDDSMTIRQNLAIVLRRSGYQVIQATDGLEGLEQLRQTAMIHAVISDVDMPNMNGLEFLRNCRQQFTPEQLPVIMLTSRNTENYRQLAKRLGASAYMGKPYLDSELLKTLQDCLAKATPLVATV
jgi:two-component system, chemotaxis family, sensor histidine kinase and response regulator PixL